jgi:hypothetical protein
MSSIYRKGRDGYFYYQTYVFNPESNKKDKRIFHSLSTKNKEKAEEKKIELDHKYQEKKTFVSFFSKKLYFTALTFISVLILFFFLKNNKSSSTNIKINQIDKPDIGFSSNRITEQKILEPILVMDQVKGELLDVQTHIHDEKSEDSKKDEYTIPEYTVEQIEEVSGAFNQGKITITVSKEVSSQDQYLLCKKLKEIYNNFSNIIICVYADTPIGKELANGRKSGLNIKDQKNSWLSMFTYNSVEGEYFNSNPSAYLSNN